MENEIIDFGTFKGKTYEYLYEHEYEYFLWLVKNVRKIHPKLRKILKPNGWKIIKNHKGNYCLTKI